QFGVDSVGDGRPENELRLEMGARVEHPTDSAAEVDVSAPDGIGIVVQQVGGGGKRRLVAIQFGIGDDIAIESHVPGFGYSESEDQRASHKQTARLQHSFCSSWVSGRKHTAGPAVLVSRSGLCLPAI